MFSAFLLLVSVLMYLLYRKATKKFDYWASRYVPCLEPVSLLGNYGRFITMKKCKGTTVQEICQLFPDAPYIGAYYGTEPTLIVQDPSIIKLITTKDFNYFHSREIAEHTHREVATQSLFFAHGDQWKAIRQQVEPLFSSAKVKDMFPLMEQICFLFEKYLDHETSDVIEIKTLMTRFTMACTASCGFGAEVNSLNKKLRNNIFLGIGQLISPKTNTRGYMTALRAIWPRVFYGIGLKTYSDAILNFFKCFVIGEFEARNYEETSKNDIIDLLLNWRNREFITAQCLANEKTGRTDTIDLAITDSLLISQCISLFSSGFENSSTTLTFLLYELAKKPDVQMELLEEVDKYLLKQGNRLKYNCMTELPYARACIQETLRLHPALGVITRELVEDYTMPDGLRLDKGVRIHLPVYHLHHNPDFFPDPEEFRPERFLGDNKKDINLYTYMPFGAGPRVCIGTEFAMLQMIAGVVTLLKKYRVDMMEDTPRMLQYDPRALVATPTVAVPLKLVPRRGWEWRKYPKLMTDEKDIIAAI